MTPSLVAGQVPDEVLVRRFLRGDESAFRSLHERYSPRLRAVIRRILGPEHLELDDVVQETWLAGCRGMSGYRGHASFFTWLATVGIRAAYRKAARRQDTEELLSDECPAPPMPDAASVIDIERALAELPARARAVVVLHDVEGFTHDEIAQQLEIAPGTSKNTLMRARAELRRILNAGRVGEAYV